MATGMDPSSSSVDLDAELRSLLVSCDMGTETSKTIRRQLEQRLGMDLEPRKEEIKEKIKAIVQEMQAKAAEEPEPEEEDADEDEDEDEDPAPTKSRSKPAAMSTHLSDELMSFLGTDDETMPRKEVLQRIRQYMKDQNLAKDPRDGRKTILDAPLQGLFGVKTVTAININKYLSKHMKRWVDTPVEEEDDDDDEEEEEEEKPPKAARKATGTKRKASPKKAAGSSKKSKTSGGGGGFGVSKLSPALQAVVGHEELPRNLVVKELWRYIKENELQNPKDKRQIMCDGPLKKVFGQDQVGMMQMNKFLSQHLSKA